MLAAENIDVKLSGPLPSAIPGSNSVVRTTDRMSRGSAVPPANSAPQPKYLPCPSVAADTSVEEEFLVEKQSRVPGLEQNSEWDI
jgi:hypothetical protein